MASESLQEIFKRVLVTNPSLLQCRDDLDEVLSGEIPQRLQKDYSALKKAIQLGTGEFFAGVGIGDWEKRERALQRLKETLEEYGMSALRVEFVTGCFAYATEVLIDADALESVVTEDALEDIEPVSSPGKENPVMSESQPVKETVAQPMIMKPVELPRVSEASLSPEMEALEERKNKRHKQLIFVGIGVILSLLTVAYGFLGSNTIKKNESKSQPKQENVTEKVIEGSAVRQTLREYFDFLKAGRLLEAYDMLHEETKKQIEYEVFIEGLAKIRDNRVYGIELQSGEERFGNVRLNYRLEVFYGDGKEKARRLYHGRALLLKDKASGKWKIYENDLR